MLQNWPTQACFPLVMKMAICESVHLRANKFLLHLPANPMRLTCNTSNSPSWLASYQANLIGHGISTKAKDIIMVSWRTKQYGVYLKQFCKSKGINLLDASVENGINFLATLFTSGLGYSAINTARSALSSVLILPNNLWNTPTSGSVLVQESVDVLSTVIGHWPIFWGETGPRYGGPVMNRTLILSGPITPAEFPRQKWTSHT